MSVFSFRNNGGTAQYSMNSGSTRTNFKNPVGTRNIYSNGTYDVTNYAGASVNVSTSLSETTLWTNSNPTSSSGFANQTVSLNSSMGSYNYIKIYGRVASSNASEIYTIVKRSDFEATGSSAYSASVALGARSSGNAVIARTAWYVSSTQVGFSNGFSSGGVISQACIPTKITGLR